MHTNDERAPGRRAIARSATVERLGFGAAAVLVVGASLGGVAAASPPLPPPVVHLVVVDPGYPGGFQVGDQLTVTVRVTRGRITPGGTVRVASDERYDRGCAPARLSRHATAVCYLTFYVPGIHTITARFVALDHRVASASISLRLTSQTGA